jgi:uncharacterized phage protein gp47/JayE
MTIPTIQQIKDQIISDIESKIGQTIPILTKAFFRVFAGALAGILYLLYRFGLWVYNQIFPQLADDAALIMHGEQFGIIRIPAVASELTADATGTPEEIIPAGTLWQQSGIVFIQTELAEIDEYGEVEITIEALLPGSDGNLIDGSEIEMVTPQSGVDRVATIVDTTTEGRDQEDIEDYRDRVLFRLGNRPQGGAAPDYILWAMEVSGVVKAFAFHTADGEVTVYPLVSLTEDRIPDYDQLVEIEEYLQDPVRRPLCANVYTAPMEERVFHIDVTSLSPDTYEMRQALETAWTNFLLTRFPNQYTGQAVQTDYVAKSALYKEASNVGVDIIDFDLYIDYEPVAINYYLLLSDELAIIGDITWPS